MSLLTSITPIMASYARDASRASTELCVMSIARVADVTLGVGVGMAGSYFHARRALEYSTLPTFTPEPPPEVVRLSGLERDVAGPVRLD